MTIDVQNFLFRTGPVVAKVYIGGFGTTLDDAGSDCDANGARPSQDGLLVRVSGCS